MIHSYRAVTPSQVKAGTQTWFLLYDPALDLADALEQEVIRSNLVNSMATTFIDVDLTYYRPLNGTAAYFYGLFIKHSITGNLLMMKQEITKSTSGNLCEQSANNVSWCHMTLLLQIPSFRRAIVEEQMQLLWRVRQSFMSRETSSKKSVIGCSRVGWVLVLFCTISQLDHFWASMGNVRPVALCTVTCAGVVIASQIEMIPCLWTAQVLAFSRG